MRLRAIKVQNVEKLNFMIVNIKALIIFVTLTRILLFTYNTYIQIFLHTLYKN